MNIVRLFAVRHTWGIICALIVGAITVLPSILAPIALGNDYRGIQFLPLNDEETYRARIHEVLDGHWRVASPVFYEYKNVHSLIPSINEFFYALPAYIFGLSFVMIASKFIFPILIFFLAYLLIIQITEAVEPAGNNRPRWDAIAGGLLVIFYFEFIDYQFIFPSFLDRNISPTSVYGPARCIPSSADYSCLLFFTCALGSSAP